MKRTIVAVFLALAALAARAQLTIDITTSGGRQIPVAILPFAGEAAQPQPVSPVVGADLARTGLFRLVNAVGVSPLPTEPSEVNFVDWQARSSEALVIGKIEPQADGRVEVRFRLFDVQKQSQLASFSYVVAPAQLRATAHRIADVIYEKLTGEKGVFSTKITYVVKRGTRYELQVSDADGANAQTVLASNEPIISPAWSPDGSRIAYVSFDQKKPVVVVQNLAQGTTRVVASFWGNNSAPAWSPDGSKLAVTLTKRQHLAALPHPRRRRRAAPHDRHARHRHRGQLLARRQVRSPSPPTAAARRRSTDARAGRRGAAAHLRGNLQRAAALQPRRQVDRLRAARGGALPHRRPRARHRPGDGAHRRHARRFAHATRPTAR